MSNRPRSNSPLQASSSRFNSPEPSRTANPPRLRSRRPHFTFLCPDLHTCTTRHTRKQVATRAPRSKKLLLHRRRKARALEDLSAGAAGQARPVLCTRSRSFNEICCSLFDGCPLCGFAACGISPLGHHALHGAPARLRRGLIGSFDARWALR